MAMRDRDEHTHTDGLTHEHGGGDRQHTHGGNVDAGASTSGREMRTGVDMDADRDRLRDDERTVQLREEELVANKRMVEAGEVELRKDVVSEQRTVEVPVTREEVVIERRSVDRQPVGGTIDATGEVIEVPIREEQVSFDKRVVVAEEVSVGKRAVQETERVSDTVRKEVLEVETEGDVDVNRGSRRA